MKLNNFIENLKEDLDFDSSSDDQVKWYCLKLVIRKFTISYCKIRAKNNRKIKNDLENKLKDLQNDLNNYDKVQEYNKTKSELDEMYKKFVGNTKLRSKCTWHEKGEKSTIFLSDLEKNRAF